MRTLANRRSKGLWMPMGLEVKVMQCWRCKAYGHRTGDRECPLANTGNVVLESERLARDERRGRASSARAEGSVLPRRDQLSRRPTSSGIGGDADSAVAVRAGEDPMMGFGSKRKRDEGGGAGILGSLIADIRAERKEKKRKKDKKKKKSAGRRPSPRRGCRR